MEDLISREGMKIGDVYYEKHTVTEISHRTNTVSETQVEIVNILPIEVLDKIRAEIESCREDEEPHLCDYRYHRNEGLDMALDIINKYLYESEVEE